MSAAKSIAERNLAAECRGVESGHRAFVQPDGSIRVVSDSYRGKAYIVRFRDAGPVGVVFTCDPTGEYAYRDDHGHRTSRTPGLLTCQHAALAARRLEREGLVVNVDGVWFAAPAADKPTVSDDDLFAGFD